MSNQIYGNINDPADRSGGQGNGQPGNTAAPGDQAGAASPQPGNGAASQNGSSPHQVKQEARGEGEWKPSHDGVAGDLETNVHGTGEALSKAKQAMSGFMSGDANIVDAAMAVKGAFDAVTQLSGQLSASLMMPVMKALGPFKGQAILPAARQMDPMMGIDVHMVTIPPSPAPVPMPHPYVGMLFNAKDWVSVMVNTFKKAALDALPPPAEDDKSVMASVAENKEAIANIAMGLANLGASVKFGDVIPRAITGTPVKSVPHIPMGAGFHPAFQAAVEKNNGKAFLGSLFVVADGDPMMGSFHLNYDCWDVGVVDLFKALRGKGKMKQPSPPEPGAPKAELFAPTGTVMPIPGGRPVLVNSIPTPINPLAILDKLFKAGLGKLKRAGVEALINRAKKTGLGKKMGCDFWSAVSKKHGTGQSHPVDVSGGYFYTANEDFRFPGTVPLIWERTWQSFSVYDGPLGYGWHHSYDLALNFDFPQNVALIRLADGRPCAFDIPTLHTPAYNRTEKLTLHIHEEGYYYATDAGNLIYRFTSKKYKNPFSKTEGHLLQSVANRNGFAIRFSYDDNGMLTKIIDSAGRILKVHHNGHGRITGIEAPHPQNIGETFSIASYTYSDEGDMIRQTDALQQPMIFEYRDHLMLKEIWRNGLTWVLRYNGSNNNAKCVEVTGDRDLLHYIFDYNDPGCTLVTNSLGNKKSFYHRNGQVIKYIDPRGGIWQYRYNRHRELEYTIDPLENQSAYTHDEWGNTLTALQPDGLFTQLNYFDKRFPLKPTEIIDERGGKWKFEYDDGGNLIMQTSPVGGITRFEYADGLLRQIINPTGAVTILEYDKDYNLKTIIAPNKAVTGFEYDGNGNCVEIRNAKGRSQYRDFDLLGRVTAIRDFDKNHIRLSYDALDNITLYRDDVKTVEYTYNGMHKMRSRSEAGANLHFVYDTEEQLRKVINEHGEQYIFELDAAGNVIVEKGFDGLTRTYDRNIAGWITRVHRPANRYTGYNYDEAGRVTEVVYEDGSREVYKYEKGALQQAVNDTATVSFKRDILGRIVKEQCNEAVIESGYDITGNRTAIKSSLGADIQLGYDIMGDVILQQAMGWEAEISRDEFGLEFEKFLPGGITSRQERDATGKIINHTVLQTGANNSFRIKHQRKYKWGVNDRLKQVIDQATGTTQFEHDEWGNLAKTVYSDGTVQLRNPGKTGNLFETEDQTDRKYARGGKLLESRNAYYKYDEEGFLIEKTEKDGAAWKYEWNVAGMLARVTRPDGNEVSFGYDALGRRQWKKYKKTTTHYRWDGNKPLHEWKTFDTYDATPDEIITWVFEEDSFAPAAKTKGEKKYSILADHLGTPVQMYKADGEIIWESSLDSYGRMRVETGEKGSCPFRYQGQYEDSETGLYYNRFRYYDDINGNYISQDPIGLKGSSEFYSYVSDPNKFIDLFGLERGLWDLTRDRSSAVKVIGGRTYYQHDSTGLWWSRDTAGHGGSAFKVFTEGPGGTLNWYRDADEYGDFIDPESKHKGPKGKTVCS